MNQLNPKVLHESLQPLMVSVYRPQDGPREQAWFDEANKRLLGKPERREPIFWHPSISEVVEEATGLHKYGDNHLRPEFDMVSEVRAELLDAVNMLGPLRRHRIQAGVEQEDLTETGLIAHTLECVFDALSALDDIEEIRKQFPKAKIEAAEKVKE